MSNLTQKQTEELAKILRQIEKCRDRLDKLYEETPRDYNNPLGARSVLNRMDTLLQTAILQANAIGVL